MTRVFLTMFSIVFVLSVANADTRTSVMKSVPPSPEAQVTFMNWSEQPYNHWAFQNIGVQPSVMVPRGGDIVLLPENLNPDVANIEFEFAGQSYTVHDAMAGDDTDGYVVLKDGEIIYEHYFSGYSEHDHHLWASSTKSLVGLAMGLLVEQGKVNVNEKVATYLTELEGTYFGERTVRDVINMVSALDYSEDYENFTPGAVSTEYFRRLGFIPAFDLMETDPMEDDTPRGILEFVPRFEQNPDLEPRVKFEYHSPNVDVAGWIIARISGQALNAFMAEHVWSKIGAEHDAFFLSDVAFNPIATGGFNTTLRDFARVGLVVLNDGLYNGFQIFPKDWIDDTFALTDEERGHTIRSAYGDEDSAVFDPWLEGYKNYLWVHDSKNEIGTFRGVFGQNLYINRRDQIVIATFSSAASASNAARATNKPRMAAFDAIANFLAE